MVGFRGRTSQPRRSLVNSRGVPLHVHRSWSCLFFVRAPSDVIQCTYDVALTNLFSVCVCVCECVWKLRSQGGELSPLDNQLSGAVGGRASSALISNDKASLRAVSAGGASSTTECGTEAQTVVSAAAMPPAAAASGLLLAAMAKNSSRLHTPRPYALSRREAHAPRRGGGMRNDAARDAFRGPEIKLLMPCVT